MRAHHLLALLLLVVGCGGPRVSSELTPYRAGEAPSPVLHDAVLAYEGDMTALSAAGAEIVGTLAVRGDRGVSGDQVRARAAADAAKAGGTHVVVAQQGKTVTWYQSNPTATVTKVDGKTYVHVAPGVAISSSSYTGEYVVVRVPTDRWSELPDPLKPVVGTHLDGAWPAQAPPAPSGIEWSCASGPDDEHGICAEDTEACEAARLEGYGACERRPAAVCFTTEAGVSCHTSFPACRTRSVEVGTPVTQECAAVH